MRHEPRERSSRRAGDPAATKGRGDVDTIVRQAGDRIARDFPRIVTVVSLDARALSVRLPLVEPGANVRIVNVGAEPGPDWFRVGRCLSRAGSIVLEGRDPGVVAARAEELELGIREYRAHEAEASDAGVGR